MTVHRLVWASGEVTNRRQEAAEPPALAPAKGRWFREVDSPPSFDPAWQTRSGPAWTTNSGDGTVTASYVIAAKPLAEMKTERKAALASYRYAREIGGITIGGAAIRTDLESQGKIVGAHALVAADPERVIDWKGADGWVRLDAATMTAIALAVGSHIQACYSAEKAHAEAIDACETAEAAGTYDFTTGWPE